MPSEVTKYLSRIGRRGGHSRSAAKLAAVRVNLKKAQAARRKYPPLPPLQEPEPSIFARDRTLPVRIC